MLNYTSLVNSPDLMTTLKAFEGTIKYSKINCCRIGIVESYDAETRIAKVIIANKLVIGQTDNGAQITQNYSPIFAKVLFFGWKDIGITHPVLAGTEGILLFNDREIESWFINGNINNLAYDRAHAKTDAIFIAGVLSMPNMITTLQDYLHFFYKDTFLKLGEEDVKFHTVNVESDYTDKKETYKTKEETFTTKTEKGDINLTGNITQVGNTTQTGNNTIAGTLNATIVQDTSAATGDLVDSYGKKIAYVENGIVRTIY